MLSYFVCMPLAQGRMGNSESITEAYQQWQDDTGDAGQLREYIARNKQHIETDIFEVCS